MSLIDFTIPNLYNGVSEQPVTIRLPNQVESQINSFSSVTNGLTKRNGAALVRRSRLHTGDPEFPTSMRIENTLVRTLKGINDVGIETTYQLIINTEFGRMWLNKLQAPQSTTFIKQDAYLIGQPKDFRIINDGNEVFILNNKKVVTGTNTTNNDFLQQGSLVYVASGNFSTDYYVQMTIKDSSGVVIGTPVTVSHTIASASTIASSDVLKTSVITADLAAKLTAAATGTYAGIVVTSESSGWIQVKYLASSTNVVELKAYTSNNRLSIFAYNRITKSLDYLPSGPDGYNMLVDSDASDSKDNYYIQYNAVANAWQEEKKLGLTFSLDPDTLPIKIPNVLGDPLDVDYLKRIEVNDRLAGDDGSNPLPSFVDKKINDIFLFNNRFGILAGSSVIMSRIDEYATFFRTSTATVLGSDRIDLKASLPSTRGTDLKTVIPFDNELIITSETAQYSLKSNAAFDPKTASLSTLTEYNIDTECQPLNIGTSIYMASRRDNASSILDFSRRSDIGMLAEDITQHIPSYLKGTVRDMVANTVENILFLRTSYNVYDSKTGDLLDSTNDTLYVQNRFIRDARLIQNAWHKWIFKDEEILGIDIVGSKLYITTTTNNREETMDNYKDVFVQSVDFSVKQLGTTSDLKTINFIPHLDGLRGFSKGNLSAMGGDAFTFDPLDILLGKYFLTFTSQSRIVMVTDKGQIIRGRTKINTFINDIVIPDTNISVNTRYYLGFEFVQSFMFSEQVVASYEGGEKQVNLHSSMILRNMKLSYDKSGKFDVTIYPKGRDSFTQQFSGMILGDPSATLGRINISTGVFKFSIGAKPSDVKIEVTSNYPFPTAFNTAEIQASVVQRSGRL